MDAEENWLYSTKPSQSISRRLCKEYIGKKRIYLTAEDAAWWLLSGSSKLLLKRGMMHGRKLNKSAQISARKRRLMIRGSICYKMYVLYLLGIH